jgi:hypothetical protein
MAKQLTERCHWVPQSYLKASAAEGNGSRIWRFSKNESDPELKRIDKVAVKFHLYHFRRNARGLVDEKVDELAHALEAKTLAPSAYDVLRPGAER